MKPQESIGYRNNHYVPQWYQRRFLQADARQRELHYLSLQPQSIVDVKGIRRPVPQRRRRSLRDCFVEEDLYTLRFGGQISTTVEQQFFGEIDRRGAKAVEWWGAFEHPSMDRDAIRDMTVYLSSQKLRTPKGLDWLSLTFSAVSDHERLRALIELRTLFSTIWTESVWQLADAAESTTKFIVTDHPVTVYNRFCGPRHESCRGANDPDIRQHAAHTIFPIDLNRVLILTNRSWALDPYQAPTALRPNPDFYRDSVFNILEVQTGRQLSEREVREINFILKSRAYRFIGAAEEEWLYPERHVSKSDWNRFGKGYLLMPDPQDIHEGGETILGYDDGRTEAFDSFGRRPWDTDYAGVHAEPTSNGNLQEFKDEFRLLFGEKPRGSGFHIGRQPQ